MSHIDGAVICPECGEQMGVVYQMVGPLAVCDFCGHRMDVTEG